MPATNAVLAHEPDAAWIIALWKAIHGGDPSPEQVAASVIAVMASYLGASADTLTAQQMQAGFESLGVQVSQPRVEALEEPVYRPPRQYCFTFQGKVICATLPSLQAAYQTA
jgi:hypothetical protein